MVSPYQTVHYLKTTASQLPDRVSPYQTVHHVKTTLQVCVNAMIFHHLIFFCTPYIHMHVYGEYKVQSKEYRVLCMICTIQQNRLEADQITPKEIQKTLPNAMPLARLEI